MSSTGVDLTESLVKAKSRTFDLESIFTLQLSGCKLRALHACLNSCVDLASIDLSHNQLTSSSLGVLDGRRWPKLKSLNLAGNRIDTMANLPYSHSLTTLHLEGNLIGDTGSFAQLRERCPNLRTLFLTRGNQTNPVCAGNANYRMEILAFFPHLKVLDGERLGLGGGSGGGGGANGSFQAVYTKLERETAQYADGKSANNRRASQEVVTKESQQQVAAKLVDWFPQASWPAVVPAEVDAELAPRLNQLKVSLKDCAKVLTEECDAHLREMEKKYNNTGAKDGASSAGGGEATAAPSPSSGEGDFGTFGED